MLSTAAIFLVAGLGVLATGLGAAPARESSVGRTFIDPSPGKVVGSREVGTAVEVPRANLDLSGARRLVALDPAPAVLRGPDAPQAGNYVAGAPGRRSGIAAQCTVSTTVDDGPGSLRQCMSGAAPGGSIYFDPHVFLPSSPATIEVLSELPTIGVDGLTIDASGAGVVVDGNRLQDGNGLVVGGVDSVTIRGLQIVRFNWQGILLSPGTTNAVIGGDRTIGIGPTGQGNVISGCGGTALWIGGADTSGNHVLGNLVGTDVTGHVAWPNENGIVITDGSHDNVVGGGSLGEGNIVSGNTVYGVIVQRVGSDGNKARGNYVGIDIDGVAPLPNSQYGFVISDGAMANTVGGVTAGDRNVISANGQSGIWLGRDRPSGNAILGNYVGTDQTGNRALGNGLGGIVISRGAVDNVIGGLQDGAGNVISGNKISGIGLVHAETRGNRILGNRVGTDAAGARALGNSESGISASYGVISTTIANNLVSGNAKAGIALQDAGTSGNTVRGNYVGTSADGTAAIANGRIGIAVTRGAQDNVIGGDEPEHRNVVCGNGQAGVLLQDAGTAHNTVRGNFLGIDVSGTLALGNGTHGVEIGLGARDNTVGGRSPGDRNVIGGNTSTGVAIFGNGTRGNRVLNNFIGTDVTGRSAVGNGQVGVMVVMQATENTIGGDEPGTSNVISGNGLSGIQISEAGTARTRIQGNLIGTDASGMKPIPNGEVGILMASSTTDNIVGGLTPAAGNLVSGNILQGIVLYHPATTGNRVIGNLIGVDAEGTALLANGEDGIMIGGGAHHNVIGGVDSGAANQIRGNGRAGVRIEDEASVGNTISRCSIFDNHGLPIDWVDTAEPADPVTPPDLHAFDDQQRVLSGRACAGCLVEVFANRSARPDGAVFVADVSAGDDDRFEVTLLQLPPSTAYLGATATDAEGTTSEFSSNLLIRHRYAIVIPYALSQ